MRFSIKDFFSKCDQMSNLLKKSLMENFIFYVVPKISVEINMSLKVPQKDIFLAIRASRKYLMSRSFLLS